MKKIDLRIMGTQKFIDETKEKIKENLKAGLTVEESVGKALPDTFPKEIKDSIINITKQYVEMEK